MKTHQEKETNFNCLFCKKSYKTKQALEKHKRMSCPEPDKKEHAVSSNSDSKIVEKSIESSKSAGRLEPKTNRRKQILAIREEN